MTGPDIPDPHQAHPATGDGAPPPGNVPGDQAMAAAVDLLVRALRALGGAGHPEVASRLAGHAWSALRTDQPRAADRMNGLLHYLARLPAGEAPSTPPRHSRSQP